MVITTASITPPLCLWLIGFVAVTEAQGPGTGGGPPRSCIAHARMPLARGERFGAAQRLPAAGAYYIMRHSGNPFFLLFMPVACGLLSTVRYAGRNLSLSSCFYITPVPVQ